METQDLKVAKKILQKNKFKGLILPNFIIYSNVTLINLFILIYSNVILIKKICSWLRLKNNQQNTTECPEIE